VAMCTPSATLNYDDLARTIVKISQGSGKTMLAALMGLAEGIQNKEILSEGGIPHFTYAESAIKTLEAMYRFSDSIRVPVGQIKVFDADKKRVREVFDNVRKSGRINLVEEEGYEVLGAYGFTTPKTILATNAEQSVNASNSIGYPVVMKIASPDIIHKSDAGGVKVGLANDEQVRTAFNAIIQNAKTYKPDANIKGIIVQEMVRSGKEIILGAKQDPIFGPLVLFGLGGIYVEVLKDVVFRLAPIDEYEASRMVHSIKGFRLLKGVRGEGPSDIRALVDSLLRISQLVTEFPEINEFDMNPLMVLGEGNGVRTVDVRISLKS
ncbi:MAG TPA: acetate--CoA ligase family protein, partial [Candidatus Bathyarchaeia archaeon]|nr:acetate--CoA ligase family protein [Candidatus Bathyarchaeia archaeon]